MEALKKQRKAYRTAFSKALTAFTEVMASSQNREEKIVAFQFLETKMTELDSVHSEYNKALFASQMSDEEIYKELETHDQYMTKYFSAKLAMTELPNPAKTRKWPHLELPSLTEISETGYLFGANLRRFTKTHLYQRKINSNI